MNGEIAGLRLVADVGGTNSRVALFNPADGSLHALRDYRNADHSDFGAVLETWFQDARAASPEAACIAVAAPPSGDTARMSNINWVLHGPQLARQFGIGRLRLINDFQANAFALPQLRREDCYTLQQGDTAVPRRLAVLGPGTGLGGAVLEMRASGPHVIPCEPGQMDIAPRDALQAALWTVLQRQHPRIYAELLLSGAGLQRLYRALGVVEGRATHNLEAAGITTAGLAGSDPLCVAALEQFCALLGAACANFLLANGCYEALYLAGGILPRMLAFLQDSPFLARFHDTGPLQATLQRTAVNVITHRHPGLLGAGYAPLADAGD